MKKTAWLIIAAAAIPSWLAVDTCNNNEMTTRQQILKKLYPALTGITRMTGSKNAIHRPETPATPKASFHDLSMNLITGEAQPMGEWQGKMVLLVNTASDCGYTAQYEQLQQLQDQYRDRLVILGFPANDFKQQEKGSNADIASFCKRNYGVAFPLASKSQVVKGPQQNPVFQWLSERRLNGWNDRPPIWNFTKYLVDGTGSLMAVFEPSVDPLDPALTSLLDAKGPA